MRELYMLELMRLERELKGIEGFYIDQFYEVEQNRFRIKLSRQGTKANLQCSIPNSINRTETIEISQGATGFSIAMRRRISGALIKEVHILNNDRILAIELSKSGEALKIIMEMFGKGNIVLANESMNILLAYRNHDFKDRSVRPNRKYEFPENSSINLLDNVELKELEKEMQNGKEGAPVLDYLSRKASMGKMYLIEALERSGISKSAKLNGIGKGDFQKLSNAIESIIKESQSGKPIAYMKDGAIADFALCAISKYSSLGQKRFDTLEGALEFMNERPQAVAEERSDAEERILSSIEKQKGILAGMDEDIKRNREIGRILMENMAELNEVISGLRSSRKPDINELKHAGRIEILSINLKDKSAKIRVKSE